MVEALGVGEGCSRNSRRDCAAFCRAFRLIPAMKPYIPDIAENTRIYQRLGGGCRVVVGILSLASLHASMSFPNGMVCGFSFFEVGCARDWPLAVVFGTLVQNAVLEPLDCVLRLCTYGL